MCVIDWHVKTTVAYFYHRQRFGVRPLSIYANFNFNFEARIEKVGVKDSIATLTVLIFIFIS